MEHDETVWARSGGSKGVNFSYSEIQFPQYQNFT